MFFCYISSFYKDGKSFFIYKIDRILEEIDSMKGRHLYFLDDNLFADKKLSNLVDNYKRAIKQLDADPDVVRDMIVAFDKGFPIEGDCKYFEGNSHAHL